MQDLSSARHERDIRWLHRNFFLLFVVFILIATFGGIALTAYLSAGPNQGSIAFLLVGIGFPLFAVSGIVYTLWWSHRALWVFKSAEARPMWLTLEADSPGSNSDYYACLRERKNEEAYLWKPSIKGPHQTTKDLLSEQVKQEPNQQHIPVKVYVDPRTGKPLVIETEIGLLWLF